MAIIRDLKPSVTPLFIVLTVLAALVLLVALGIATIYTIRNLNHAGILKLTEESHIDDSLVQYFAKVYKSYVGRALSLGIIGGEEEESCLAGMTDYRMREILIAASKDFEFLCSIVFFQLPPGEFLAFCASVPTTSRI